MTALLPPGYDHQIYATLDSTNEEAKRQILNNRDLGPTWIQAYTQSAGKGRRGNSWTSDPGNLFCSLALPLDCELADAANLAFVAALAVGKVLESHVPADMIQFKWPNDVLLNQRKVAGILLEVQPKGEHLWLIIGIGVNVASIPEGVHFPAEALNHVAQGDVSLDGIMIGLAGAFDQWLTVWRQEGFPSIREAWLKRAARINMDIRVQLPHETLTGTFEGLDPTGALRLALPTGKERLITAGDVFFDVSCDLNGQNVTDR